MVKKELSCDSMSIIAIKITKEKYLFPDVRNGVAT